MKILHILSSIDNGGAENQVVKLACLQKKNHLVSVVYFSGNDFWKKKLQDENIVVKKFEISKKNNFFNLLYQFIKLLYFCKKKKPEAIHAHLSISEIYAFFLSFFFKFKFYITKHLDSFYFESSRSQNQLFSGLFLEKLVFRRVDKVFFISKAVQKYFLNKIKIKKTKYDVIYYLIDIKKYQNVTKKKISKFKNKYLISSKSFKVGCIARHVRQKNLFFLINCFKCYAQINPNSELIIVGKGPLTQKLKYYSKNLGIYKKIKWITYLNDTSPFYQSIDIFFLPSRYEGLGVVFIEAMSAGIPIISLNQSAMPEIIKNNYNGILIKENETEFIKAVKKIRKKIFYKKIVRNNLKTARLFDISNKNFINYSDIY